MPMVTNILRVQGSMAEAADILASIADAEAGRGSIDFRRITPMPDWVYQGELDSKTLNEQGENSWLDWCRDNWKIEWNAVDPCMSAALYDGGDMIRFETKDKDVRYLMEKLSRIYGGVYFDYLWANEDVDRGAGACQFKGGLEMVSYTPTPGSKAAYELAFDILHTAPEDHGLIYDDTAGNYVLRGGGQFGRGTD